MIVVPEADFDGQRVRRLTMTFQRGEIIEMTALPMTNQGSGSEELRRVGKLIEKVFYSGDNSSRQFREFALGMNPRLVAPAGSEVIPYYGYGAGVVRLSLGNNEELGGKVKGNFVRWFFFPDASVEVDGRSVVRDGELTFQAGGGG